jgi:hypothetical protein
MRFMDAFIDELNKLAETPGAVSAAENPIRKQMRLQQTLRANQAAEAAATPKPSLGPPTSMAHLFMSRPRR